MKVWLSPTRLGLIKECERCGYDEMMLKLKRPRSPFPSLPNGIDRIVKEYMDKFRGTLPPELAHLEGHRFMDEQSTINDYREWNGGLKCVRNVTVDRPTKLLPERKVTHTLVVSGAIDDALYNDTNQVVPLDVKTKDKEPDENYGEKWYTTQINSYGYMFKENGYEVADYGYLWYFWPLDVKAGGMIQFGQKLLKMKIDLQDIPNRLDKIAQGLPTVSMEALRYRKLWKAAPECPACTYLEEKEANAAAEVDSNA